MANLNLNTFPYYDDFASEKGFHRILFKPGYAVQARELTQAQTILQEQIKRFGNHVFKDGTVVLGCPESSNFAVPFVKILDTSNTGSSVDGTVLASFEGTILTGANQNVKAVIKKTVTGAETDSPNLKTLYLHYQATGTDNSTTTFIADEVLTVQGTGETFVVADVGETPVGEGALLSVNDGIVYANGNFIVHNNQTVVLDRYDITPTVKVGFVVKEEILSSTDDETLLDPAQGSYNYTAPGADRYKLTTVLTVVNSDETAPTGFYILFDIEDGNIKRKYNKTEYAELNKTLARRTNDESGDYTVRSFPLIMREHLDDGTNNGRYTAGEGGDASKIVVGVEPGKAYVKGYEHELFATEYLPVDKAIDTAISGNEPITTAYGSYVTVDDVAGVWSTTVGSTIQLRNAVANAVTSTTYSATTPPGSQIGTARVRAIEYVSNTVGTAAAQYKIYLYDIIMTSGSFSAVKSLYYNGPTTVDAFADIVAATAVLESSSYTPAIFPSPFKNLKDVADASYVYRKLFSGITVATAGTFTTPSLSGGESWAFTSLPGASDISREIIVVASTAFTGGTLGTKAAGQILNPSTVTYTSSTVLNFNLGATTTGTPTVDVYVNVRKTTPTQNSKTVNRSRFVKFDTASSGPSSAAQPTGPYCLGYYDVVTIESVWSADNTEAFPSSEPTGGAWSNVTSSFVLNNGQKDGYYDLSTITTSATFTNKKLIVKLTYFEHGTSSAYYTVDSYPLPAENAAPTASQINWYEIPSYQATNGTAFNLRDSIDFRPTVTATATDSVNIAGATLNPATTNTSFLAGFVHPAATEEFISDLTYHLPRIDRIVLDTEGVFSAVRGVSSLTPVRPPEPENSMTLGYTNIAPYPSLSPYLAKLENKPEYACRVSLVDNRRFTMRDIGQIHSRIDRLEYYTSLSLLEQNTANLLVANSAGENRFKNGILVDSFTGHDVGNVYDSAYNCSISDGTLRPFFQLENIEFKYNTGSNVVRKANDAIIVVRQTIGATNFVKNSTVTSSSGATGKILHNVLLGSSSSYKWVRLYLNITTGTFAENNTITVGAITGTITYSGISDDVIPTALRPTLVVTASNGVLATLPYTHRVFAENPYASKTRNAVSQLLFNYVGTLELDPQIDTWTDTNVLPAVQLNNDGRSDNWESLNTAWGTQWGNWETTWQGTQITGASAQFGGGTINAAGGWVPDALTTINTISTETTTQRQQRTGTGINVVNETVTNNIGSRLVSATIIPYMRSRVVSINATRMKPSTRIYAFFDGINVSQHCRPSGGAFGAPMLINSAGIFSGEFRIPSNTFTVGTKSLVLCDSSTDPMATNLKTYAIASFTASGLSTTEQNTIISTQVPRVTQTRQTQTQDIVTSRIVETVRPFTRPAVDPIAQTFFISDNVNGVLLSKLDVYFQSKSTTAPITLEIREVSNGYPGETIVPFSTVTLDPKDVNISSDGSAPTEFKFSSPVYLKNSTEYCFVLLPAGNDVNYEVWVSELGQNQIGTTQRIDKQPYSGVLFVSANNRTWTAIQNEDVKFTMYQSNFSTGVTGTLELSNTPMDYISFSSIVTAVEVGDVVTFKLGGTTHGTGVVKYYDTVNNIAKVEMTSGNSQVGDDVVVSTVTRGVVGSIGNKAVNAISPTLGYLNFNNTNTAWEYKMYTTAGAPGTYTSLAPSGTTELPAELKTFSVSTTADTFMLRSTFTTQNSNISPVFDISKMACVVVNNYVNNDVTNETTNTGSAYSKYISRKVVLDDGQEADDLRIYLTADLPAGASVKVYGKFLNDTDATAFDDRPWLLMTETAPLNTQGFKEYYYTIPTVTSPVTAPAGGLSSSTGVYTYSTNYSTFKTFAVKIVLLSSSTSSVPIVRDMRAIAMQV